MYDKTHFNIVISLQLIKINGKKEWISVIKLENSQVCGDYTTKQPMIKEEIKREIRKHLETSEYGNTT